MSKKTNDSYALLIGVDDYRAYDGAQNLAGSVNDIAAWARVCNAVGMDPANVHILGTRTYDHAGKVKNKDWAKRFPGAGSVRRATRKNILAEVKWLAKKLASGKSPGLLTYSGHGDVTADGALALCPTDVEKGRKGVANLVLLKELADLLAAHDKARDLLTVVFDCCHAGLAAAPAAGTPRGGSLALSLRPDAAPAKGPRPTLGAREIYSCGPEEVAYQSEFTSQFHGAFTWALTASLLQWKPVAELGAVRLDVSYENARAVSQKLLGVLNYPNQTAVLNPGSVGKMPFFHPSTKVDGQETTREPDGARDGIQLDPDFFYNVHFIDLDANEKERRTIFADVIVTGTSPVYVNGSRTALPNNTTEYWYLNQAAIDKIGSGVVTGVAFARAELPADGKVTLTEGVATSYSFRSDASSAVGWSALTAPPGTNTNYVFGGTPASPKDAKGHAVFNVESSSTGGTHTLHAVQWYLTELTTAPSGSILDPSSDAVWSKEDGVPSPYYGATSL